MMLPPALIGIGFSKRGRNGFRLWFPFVLLWPLLFVVFVVAFAIAIPLSIVVAPWGYARPVFLFVPYVWRALSATRGLEVDVAGEDGGFFVSFI